MSSGLVSPASRASAHLHLMLILRRRVGMGEPKSHSHSPPPGMPSRLPPFPPACFMLCMGAHVNMRRGSLGLWLGSELLRRPRVSEKGLFIAGTPTQKRALGQGCIQPIGMNLVTPVVKTLKYVLISWKVPEPLSQLSQTLSENASDLIKAHN